MTTIALSRGILAADTKIVIESRWMLGSKLRITAPYTCFATAGSCRDEDEFFHWYLAGAKWGERGEKLKSFEAIQIDRFGDAYWWNGYHTLPIVDPQFAIGSGEDLAKAAMLLGKSATEAVKFASLLDVNTNDIVDYYNFKTGKIVRGK